MDQHYCLRWNKHLTNLTDVLISLLEREALCDVTLSVGNNKTIKAHQAILSACSPYFESIFIENTHPHPIMYMGNVDFEDLKAIIEYIYKGEVNIAQNSLQKFLKTAVDLQVKGLVETNNISYNPDNVNEPNLSAASPIQPPDIENTNFENNHGSNRHLDRGHFISERFGENNEPHIPSYKDHDRKNDNDPRLDLSPNPDQASRKRRKVSSCDTPSLPLQSSLSRHPSESQASSHSSFKLSPLPKSSSIEAEIDGRRKSPTNSVANAQQQQQISIKQEASDVAGSPQVHLNNPLNHNLLPQHLSLSSAPDDMLHINNLQPTDSTENEQQISHMDQGSEMDGAEGQTHYIDSHHKTSPNGNIESQNFPTGYMENDKWETQMGLKFSSSMRSNVIPNYRPPQIPSSIQALAIRSSSSTHHDDSLKWLASERSLRQSPIDYDRSQQLKLSSHHQMSYHNMFTPSQEPGTLWRCRSCGKEVTNRWHHFHSHTAQRSMCPYCPATYSRIDTLRSHLKQKHKNEHAHKNF